MLAAQDEDKEDYDVENFYWDTGIFQNAQSGQHLSLLANVVQDAQSGQHLSLLANVVQDAPRFCESLHRVDHSGPRLPWQDYQ